MNCPEVRGLFSLYIDSELDERSAFEFARHLESCPTCAERFAAEQALATHIVEIVAPSRTPTPELWRGIERSLLQRRGSRRWLTKTAAALVFVAGLSGFAAWLTQDRAEQGLPHELIAMHRKVLEGLELPQAEAADAGDVAAFFHDRVPFAVPIPRRLDVRGVRLCSLRGQYLALVFAQDAATPVSVFVLPSAVLDAFPAAAAQLGAESTLAGRAGDLVYTLARNGDTVTAAVAALSQDALRRALGSWPDPEERH